jgi:hypothetical protein
MIDPQSGRALFLRTGRGIGRLFARRTDFPIRPVFEDGLGNPSYAFAQASAARALILSRQTSGHCSFAVPLLLFVLLAGCHGGHESTPAATSGEPTAGVASGPSRGELVTYAIDNLNHLERFATADIFQQIQNRLDPKNQPTPEDPENRIDPLLATWPEPEMLLQVIDRLNQWIRTQRPPADWKVDPMMASLPKPLADLPQVKDVDRLEFSHYDACVLQEAVWLRDVGRWARGDALDDLERARNLFDWTVRNIQYDPNLANRIPQFPRETLLFGHGTATERAWVFILIARQLGINAAMLALKTPSPSPEDSPTGSAAPAAPEGAATAENFRPWCIAVMVEGNAYLFDPAMGLPIPAPDGLKLDAKNQLTIRPATLAQAAADEKVLRQLDIAETATYTVKSSDLEHVAVMLEASPTYLSDRMKLLESHLAGDLKVVLTTSPSVEAKQWKSVAHIDEARLWQRPFETLEQRSRLEWPAVQSRLGALLPFFIMPSAPLYQGRIQNLRGRFAGDDGAISFYQKARPSNQELDLSSIHDIEKALVRLGKQDASYWSGLIAYDQRHYDTAIDYFATRTLQGVANSPWIFGAQYNLARTYEAAGETNKAIIVYEGNSSSPGHFGDLLRAKWLKSLREEKKTESAAGG